MARVAVLILNYNGEQYLKKYLPSIIKHSAGCEIIVGDNNSNDNSLDLLDKFFPQVRIIKLDKNYGYAGGYNKLIARLDHEFIALVNSDIEVTPGWIDPMVALFDSDPKVAAVQPKILSIANREKFEYAGAAGGFIDRYGYPFCRGRIFNSVEDDNGQYNDTCNVFWASGACFLIKRSVFEEFSGFDDDFFAHMEEIDLCWRLNNGGFRIKYCGESKVYHLGGGTLNYANPRKTYLNFRNGWIMLIKNLPVANRRKLLYTRGWLDIASIIFYLIRFQFRNAYAIVKAHLYIRQNLEMIQLKKSTLPNNKNIVPEITPEKYSLVWQYYFKRKKRYSELIPD